MARGRDGISRALMIRIGKVAGRTSHSGHQVSGSTGATLKSTTQLDWMYTTGWSEVAIQRLSADARD